MVWDERLAEYDFGAGHPLTPIRLQLAMRLAADFDLLIQPNVQLLTPIEPLPPVDLLRVHDGDYINAVIRASEIGFCLGASDRKWGFGTADVPVFSGMHEASCRIAGATLAATRAVHAGDVEHAVNLAGGLHHAMPAAASGFASITMSPSQSPGCWTKGSSALRMSTLMSTTVTVCRRCFGMTPEC